MQERLQLAAELGQLARERQSIETSIIELSTDVSAAMRDRDKGLSMADIRKNAAQRWRDERDRQKDIDKDSSKSKGRGKGRNDDDFSM